MITASVRLRALLGLGLLLFTPIPDAISVRAQRSPEHRHAATGAVTGIVTALRDGQPVAGARITVEGERMGATSAGDGRYALVGVRAGERAILARARDSAPDTRVPVTVVAGETVILDLELP